MCRSKDCGGRRCPTRTNTGAREAHNRRRRENRATKRETVAWAALAGATSTQLAALRAAPPGSMKAGVEVPDVAPPCGDTAAELEHVDLPAATYGSLNKDERTRQMLADLTVAVQSVVASGQLQHWLDAMSSNGLSRWSANNRMLAVLQLVQRGRSLEGMHLMGFRQWEQFGRRVVKGAKAVWILAPITRKIRDEDDAGNVTEHSAVVGFRGVPVFDVADTDGTPLPGPPVAPAPGTATPGTLDGLKARVSAAGYSYEETEIPDCNPATGEGTQGYTLPRTKKIVVDARLGEAHKAAVIAHELGHVHCGHVDGDYSAYQQHRGQMETEAEMTSYLVQRSRGMTREQVDAFSPGYIANWSQGDAAVMHRAVDKAVKAFNAIAAGDWPA